MHVHWLTSALKVGANASRVASWAAKDGAAAWMHGYWMFDWADSCVHHTLFVCLMWLVLVRESRNVHVLVDLCVQKFGCALITLSAEQWLSSAHRISRVYVLSVSLYHGRSVSINHSWVLVVFSPIFDWRVSRIKLLLNFNFVCIAFSRAGIGSWNQLFL